MRISELISILNKAQEVHGDVLLYTETRASYGYLYMSEINPYFKLKGSNSKLLLLLTRNY